MANFFYLLIEIIVKGFNLVKGIGASEKGLEIFKFSINLDIDKTF